jgi:outer membrane protein OmpA-like peptidoglycan-associated protein
MTKIGAAILAVALSACSTISSAPPSSSFLVFFQENSSALMPETRPAIQSAVAAIKSTRPKTVVIAAGAVKGTTRELAEARYTAVKDALLAGGVSSSVIAQADLPLAGITASETGNQRVEVILSALDK